MASGVPQPQHTVVPYLRVKGAAKADRYGKVTDPFGHEWSPSTTIEQLSPEELQRRGAQAIKQMGTGKQ